MADETPDVTQEPEFSNRTVKKMYHMEHDETSGTNRYKGYDLGVLSSNVVISGSYGYTATKSQDLETILADIYAALGNQVSSSDITINGKTSGTFYAPESLTNSNGKYLSSNGTSLVWSDGPDTSGFLTSSDLTDYLLKSSTAFKLNGSSVLHTGVENNGFYAPTSAGSSNQMLKADSSGVPSWYTPGQVQLTLNGTQSTYSPYNTTNMSKSWYAPTGPGTTGQYLKSTGGTPTWADFPEFLTSDDLSEYAKLEDIPTLPTNHVTTSTTIFTLNGSGKTTSNNAGFYAPTGVGSNKNILKSTGSGSPSWFAPAQWTGTLNGTGYTHDVHTAAALGSWYAPTTSGTTGQYLTATTGGAPTWANFPEFLTTSDLEEYAKLEDIPTLPTDHVTTSTTLFSLNGTDKSSSSSNKSFYAPTSVGSSNQLLRSSGTGAPSWFAPGYLQLSLNGSTSTYYPNGTNNYSTTWYAPESAGTSGYKLVSSGSGAPVWEQPPYGTSGEENTIYTKTASISNFTLVAGVHVYIKFTGGNSYYSGSSTALTLNVNSTGAKNIYFGSTQVLANTTLSGGYTYPWYQNDIVEFMYDGSYWRIVDIVTKKTSHYIALNGSGGYYFGYGGTQSNNSLGTIYAPTYGYNTNYGGVLYSKSGAPGWTPNGTAGQLLMSNGTNAPVWAGPFYGTCTTSSSDAAKVTTTGFTNIKPYDGMRVQITFTNASYNSTSTAITLNVGGSGVYNVYANGSQCYCNSSSSSYWWNAGDVVEFTFHDSRWNITGYPSKQYDWKYTFDNDLSMLWLLNEIDHYGYVDNSAYWGINGTNRQAWECVVTESGIYAPYSGGSSGQYLTANGDNNAPTWSSPADSSSASAISTGTSLVTERDVYYGLPSINGSHSYNASTTYYAPTSAGTSGYFLKSSGNAAPVWSNTISDNLAFSSGCKIYNASYSTEYLLYTSNTDMYYGYNSGSNTASNYFGYRNHSGSTYNYFGASKSNLSGSDRNFFGYYQPTSSASSSISPAIFNYIGYLYNQYSYITPTMNTYIGYTYAYSSSYKSTQNIYLGYNASANAVTNLRIGSSGSTGTFNTYLYGSSTSTKIVGTTTGYATKIHVASSQPTMDVGDLWFKIPS